VINHGQNCSIARDNSHYIPSTKENDIALLRLHEVINAEPIPLLSATDTIARLVPLTVVRVTGWGQTEPTVTRSSTLQMVEVPIQSRSDCNASDAHEGKVFPNMFCAGEEHKDACFGDSGGPLTLSIAGKRFLAGLVSWGPKDRCGVAKLYGVYTNVAAYATWINDTIKADATKK